mgnify:CR=1 FL=1
MIVLDTNVSEAMKPEPNPAVLAWLNDQAAETLYISSVTLAELLFGIEALPRGRRRDQLDGALNALLELFRDRVLSTRRQHVATQSWPWRPGMGGVASRRRMATSPPSPHRGASSWRHAIPRPSRRRGRRSSIRGADIGSHVSDVVRACLHSVVAICGLADPSAGNAVTSLRRPPCFGSARAIRGCTSPRLPPETGCVFSASRPW